jgi:hypothetical protein
MHTMSVQQLLDAGVFGGQPRYQKTQTAEELHSAEIGKSAFRAVGAMPCGESSNQASSSPVSSRRYSDYAVLSSSHSEIIV